MLFYWPLVAMLAARDRANGSTEIFAAENFGREPVPALWPLPCRNSPGVHKLRADAEFQAAWNRTAEVQFLIRVLDWLDDLEP